MSVVLPCKINNVVVNSLLDSGAGKSLMDLQTAEKIHIADQIRNSNDCLFYASGNKMDICRTVKVNVNLINAGKCVLHETNG